MVTNIWFTSWLAELKSLAIEKSVKRIVKSLNSWKRRGGYVLMWGSTLVQDYPNNRMIVKPINCDSRIS